MDSSQALVSMGFPRKEYQIGLPFPSPGDLPNPEIEPRSPALQVDSLSVEPMETLHFQRGMPNQQSYEIKSNVKWELPIFVLDFD